GAAARRRRRRSGSRGGWGPHGNRTPSPADGALLVERGSDDLGGDGAVADDDLDGGAGRGGLDRDVGQADALVQRRAEHPAGDLAGGLAADPHLVAMAREGALLRDEPGQALADAFLLQAGERLAAQEVVLVELDDPAEAGLERRVVLVQVVAVQDVAE